MLRLAVIRVGIDPTFELGPLTLAWHGITIAVGILVGALVAARMARERGLDPEPITTFAVIAALAGVAGARLFYLLETGAITDPSAWVGRLGFTFSGGLVLAGLVIAAYVRRRSLSAVYLDAAAVGLALGLAIGRIGDVINGEHYGPASDFFLAVQNSHPEASVPDPGVAYHSGGLYEVLLAAAIFAVVWPLRHRLRPADRAGLDRPRALRRRPLPRVLPPPRQPRGRPRVDDRTRLESRPHAGGRRGSPLGTPQAVGAVSGDLGRPRASPGNRRPRAWACLH
ncbi:MAG: prolipoprotein diacylglyceryl transferase family protein [Thermoleophilaceae bacterium]